MNALLFRLACSRLTTVALGILVPLLVVGRGADSHAFAEMRSLEFAPYVIVGLLSGILIDVYGASRVVTMVLPAHAIPTLLAVSVAAGWLSLAWVGPAMFCLSAVGYLASASLARVAMDVVAEERFATYNSRATLIEQVAALVLPMAIGWLAGRSLFGTLVGLAMASLATLPMLRGRADAPAATDQPLLVAVAAKVKAGLQLMRERPFLLQLSVVIMLINAVEIMPGTLMIYYANHDLGLDGTHVGTLVTAGGFGGVIGAMAAERLARDARSMLALLVLSMGVNAGLYLVVYQSNGYYALLVSLAVESASVVVSAVSFRTLRQMAAGKTSFGMVQGVSGAIVKIAIPPAVLVGGSVAAQLGTRSVYLAAGLAELALVLPVAIWAFRLQPEAVTHHAD